MLWITFHCCYPNTSVAGKYLHLNFYILFFIYVVEWNGMIKGMEWKWNESELLHSMIMFGWSVGLE